MVFSIIIPTCNRSELLCNCLDRLVPSVQGLNEAAYELIVSDDSNTNETKNLIEVKYPWVEWVEGPKRGPAANRNNGVKYAKGEWLIFIDDDCLPENDILSVYLQALVRHSDIQVFEGCIKADRKQQNLLEESPINETGGYLWSCNFMINKKLFLEKLDGFDEKFPYASMEDVDLHYRLQKLYIRCMFLHNAVVIHPWRLQKKLHSITLKRFKSTLYFLDKHPERSKDINSIYYIKAFCHLFGQTLKKSLSYKFSGFLPKITNDLFVLYLAAYLFFYKKIK